MRFMFKNQIITKFIDFFLGNFSPFYKKTDPRREVMRIMGRRPNFDPLI